MSRTGRPIGTESGSRPGTQAQAVAATVTSVGPYRLCSSAPSSWWKRSRSDTGSASPMQITRRRPAHDSATSSVRNIRSIEGTNCIVVTPCRRTIPAR